jgi:C_GCAxxG_C_C family probable redox protein
LAIRLKELENRQWDMSEIEKRIQRMGEKGLKRDGLNEAQMVVNRQGVLDQVQRRAEEYEYVSHSCAKGSALAVMEQFGLGNMEIIRALSPFPGFGMTGWICGAVTGGLISLGLHFGSDDLQDYEGNGRAMEAARSFISSFEEEVGTILCPKIQEDLIFDRYMDPRGSPQNFEAFKEQKGYEKCALPPGIGARIAADIIIEDLKESLP